nr:hypothetical protein [Tanacetum cinerariifolium]GFA33368.1 hypothetical protein [Tanacetum cinerariifolium]
AEKANAPSKESAVKKNVVEPYILPNPFSGRLKNEKALEQMLKYAKFMKDLLTKKTRLEEASWVTLNERFCVVLLYKIPIKGRDPMSFTIPCIIGSQAIDKALADLGASISLMPYSMFSRLEMRELKPTRMCIELANKMTQYPQGIDENVPVKIDKFAFSVDFLILDKKEDS